jgi:hypothetical protein
MIADPVELEKHCNAWRSVRDSQMQFKAKLGFTGVGPGGNFGRGIFEACHDLTLVFAYAVLQDVLEQLKHEKRFSTRKTKPGLGELMQTSRSTLPWQDFALVDKGRNRRNDFAHHRMSVPVDECMEYIDAVERELHAWGIV